MNTSAPTGKAAFRLTGWPLLIFVLLLAAFYPQSPLYFDNQNTKFLHGAARAGWGHLGADWTANTLDPLPVFTFLVETVYRWFPPGLFHVLFALLVAVYAWAAIGIATKIHPELRQGRAAWIFAGLFALILLTPLNDELASGVAKQYILDHYLQPCVLGVFMLLGVRYFLDGRATSAALCLALAVLTHPGAYLISALLILVAITWEASRSGFTFRALIPAILFAALTIPIGVYQAVAFMPGSETTWRQAMDILANQRIPHHTRVAAWMDLGNVAKLAVLVWASWSVRGNRPLFLIMALQTGVVVLATLALLIMPNATAAFTTPWRVTAVLMPIAIVLLSAKASVWLSVRAGERKIHHIALFILTATLALGAAQTYVKWAKYAHGKSMGVIAYAKSSAAVSQLYLVPPKASDFDRFRLETGLPVLANWKSHPYLDTEVLEWWGRNQSALKIYETHDAAERNRLAAQLVERYGITHFVMNVDRTVDIPGFAKAYEDSRFAVYRRPPGQPAMD
ncbi:MAG: DUF6798 domain-containing protein [Hydrogenophilaceae bacterium]